MKHRRTGWIAVLLLAIFAWVTAGGRAQTVRHRRRHIVAAGHRREVVRRTGVRRVRVRRRAVRRHPEILERRVSSIATTDLTAGDITAGEDPVVRAAAIDALGGLNGTVVVINPMNGRILAMVDQKMALSAGAEPCSTIKVMVSLAGLKSGLVTADTPVNLGGQYSVTMTMALARSINLYFEVLGRALGFERVKEYANEFGLGELAGYHIAGEHLGVYPDEPLPEWKGGVGRMCSFGESVSMTPLQLGAMVSAIANGGTLYYLQHPTTQAEVAAFQPRVKRQLDIGGIIPQILEGMSGVVNFPMGTGHSLMQSFTQFPVFGKTGTCSDYGTRFGWFVSYLQAPSGPVVAVIFLKGGRDLSGPRAAALTGVLYRDMYERNFFARRMDDGPVVASAPAPAHSPVSTSGLVIGSLSASTP